MKRLPEVVIALCVIMLLPNLVASLLQLSASHGNTKNSNFVPISAKATFQPADPLLFSVSSSKDEAHISVVASGGDPPIPIMSILATVVLKDKKSNVFRLTSETIVGSSDQTLI